MYPLYKIKEARYFLEKLRELKPASEEFCFNFSALLSASRSVTFSMQKLYKHKEGFEEEYNKLKQNFELYPIAKELIEARNISEKEGHKVPILITTITEFETNNTLTYECDPLPNNENDVIRKIHFEYGNDDEGWIPGELPENKRAKLYTAYLYKAIARLIQSNTHTTSYGIKLYEKGCETTIDRFYEDMGSFLTILEKAAVDFDHRWSSPSLFSQFMTPK